MSNPSYILTINGGSSSIKFALFESRDQLSQIFKGSIDRIGEKRATLQVDGVSLEVLASDHRAAVSLLINWIEEHVDCTKIAAIGYRVVHGGPKYSSPQKITKDVIKDLHALIPFAPDHLPREILLIEAFYQRFPNVFQLACFDTAFHHDLPRVAKLFPIPRIYEEKGIRRYGFHGLSYEFLMEELKQPQGKVVLAHLGSGASLAAVHNGKSIDTSMGFTPTGGVPMGTRSGDLDPGLFYPLGLSAKEFNEMVNLKSGLLGISETSSDIRELLKQEALDVRASEATTLFCYQVRKWIGAFAAALGGIDTLVFSGGIGENSALIRSRICEGLQFLGVELKESENIANKRLISSETCSVSVYVIPTDEERMIAKTVYRMK